MTKEELTVKIMQDIGLEIDRNNNVIDQDTGVQLQFKGKNVKFNACSPVSISKGDVLLDPVENPTMMSQLFSHFTNKLDDEDGRYISIVYSSNTDKNGKGYVECKEGSNTLRSDEYYRDSLKYASLIMKLNGDEAVPLNELDSKPEQKRRK